MNELIALAAVALVAWFAAGTIWNVRKGSAVMRWMQEGLPLLGRRSTVRWLGSSVVELKIEEAAAPFANVTLVIFLEPRDLPWWPLSHARGRRDTLIARGVLRSAPVNEFEALDPASWSGRDALPRVPAEWPVQRGELEIHHADVASLGSAEAMLAIAREARLDVRRLSARRVEPHLQVHAALPQMDRPARPMFEALQSLAERASSPHGP